MNNIGLVGQKVGDFLCLLRDVCYAIEMPQVAAQFF
ncbi:MAG: hypothetical protein ACJA13_003012, partial [Paraglaciecola sp.]